MAVERVACNETDKCILQNDKIEKLSEFFSVSSSTIYEKLNLLGSCPMRETDIIFTNLKSTLQTICQFAMNDIISFRGEGLYSVSICLRAKTTESADNPSKYVDGYATPCAFVSTTKCQSLKISSATDNCNSSKTHIKNSKYEFINEKFEAELPHHGLSFSERFIENIEYDNNELKTNAYSLDDGLPYIYLKNRDDIANLFDDGANIKKYGKKDYPASPIQHREEVACFPIECKTGRKIKRVGYMQLTAYYGKDDTGKDIVSTLSESNILADKLCKAFYFYTNWALLANKIANINKVNLKTIHSTICSYE